MTDKRLMRYLLFILIIQNAYSQRVFDIDTENVSYTPAGNWSSIEKDVVVDMLQEIEDQAADEIEAIDTGNYLKDSADAHSLTHSLNGTDHANRFKKLLIGATVMGAFKFDESGNGGISNPEDIKGVAAGVSLLGGFKLNDRMDIFANIFKYNLSKDDWSFNTLSLGGRLRYQLIRGSGKKYKRKKISQKEVITQKSNEEKPAIAEEGKKEIRVPQSEEKQEVATQVEDPALKKFINKNEYQLLDEKVKESYQLHHREFSLARWNGIMLNAGVQLSELKVNYKKSIDQTNKRSDLGVDITANVKSTVNANINFTTFSVPLEVSTSFDLLYILSPYVGLGVNLNTGSSGGEVNLSDTSISITKSGGLGNGTAATTASANFSEKGKPQFVDPKLFLGAQINLWKLKVGFQYDQSLSTKAKGVAATLRFSH